MDYIITKDYVKVLNEDIRKKLKDKPMSASSINAIINSPGNFILDTYVEDEVKKKESIHIVRGHWFHSLMEEFFNNPNRKIEDIVLKDLVNVSEDKSLYSNKQNENDITRYKDLFYGGSDFYWMAECLKGFKKIYYNEKLDKLEVVKTELEINTEIEGIKVKAFIDSIFKDDDGLKIIDWKTGKYNENNEDYHFQQALYAMLCEKVNNDKIECAKLAYVRAGIVEDVVIDREKALERVKQAYQDFNKYMDNDYTFPFKDYKYDGWRKLLFDIGDGPKPNIYKTKLNKIAEIIK